MAASGQRRPWLRLAGASLLVGLAGASCAGAAYATLHPSCRIGLASEACAMGIGMLALGGGLLGSGIGLILAIVLHGRDRGTARARLSPVPVRGSVPSVGNRMRRGWYATQGALRRNRSGIGLLVVAASAAAAAGGFVLDVFVRSPWPADVTLRHYQASRNCDTARAVGLAPAYRGQPGYWRHLDADNDGIACEPYPVRRW